jgi:predicted ArsR family transcriptional regulator
MSAREDRLAALASLAEPLRRSLYLHVVSSAEPVSRESAAEAIGITRSVAAFHLDKLAELGVLEVEYRRPAGRGGPGAGRPAKLYRRSEHDLDFSLPERHYDLAAAILAQAVTDARTQSTPVDEALREAARDYGRVMGAGLAERVRSTEGEFERVMAVLTAHGYEPRREGDSIILGNCPFHALAEDHRELVCGMNLEVIAGVLEGTEAVHMAGKLNPQPGHCCVRVVAGSGQSA